MSSRKSSPDDSAANTAAASPPPSGVSRRRFVAGAGAAAGTTVLGVALSACASPTTRPSTVSLPPGVPAGTLAQTKDVPVGGGVITEGVVLTQPVAGTYEAFTAECTHVGCALSTVAGAAIECPCHGSRFHLDGTVAQGPAEQPLKKVAIRVQGDDIIRT